MGASFRCPRPCRHRRKEMEIRISKCIDACQIPTAEEERAPETIRLLGLPGLTYNAYTEILRAAASVKLPSSKVDLSTISGYTALWPYVLVEGMLIPTDEVDRARLHTGTLQRELAFQNCISAFPWLSARLDCLGSQKHQFVLRNVTRIEHAARTLVEGSLRWGVGPLVNDARGGCPIRIQDRIYGTCIAKDPSTSGRVVEYREGVPIKLQFMLAGGAVLKLIESYGCSGQQSHAAGYSKSDMDIWMTPHILISPDAELSDVIVQFPMLPRNAYFSLEQDHAYTLPEQNELGWNAERTLIALFAAQTSSQKVDICLVPDPATSVSCFDGCCVRAGFQITATALRDGRISVQSCCLEVSPAFAVAYTLGMFSTLHSTAVHGSFHTRQVSTRGADRAKRYLERGYLPAFEPRKIAPASKFPEAGLPTHMIPIAFDESHWPLVFFVTFGRRLVSDAGFQNGTRTQLLEGLLPEVRCGLRLADPQLHPLAFLPVQEGGAQPMDLIYREYCSLDCPLINTTVDSICAGEVHWRNASLALADHLNSRSFASCQHYYSLSADRPDRFIEISGEMINTEWLWPKRALSLLEMSGKLLQHELCSGRTCFSPYASTLGSADEYLSARRMAADRYLREAPAAGVSLRPRDVAEQVARHTMNALGSMDNRAASFYVATNFHCAQLPSYLLADKRSPSRSFKGSWRLAGKYMRCRLDGQRMGVVCACSHIESSVRHQASGNHRNGDQELEGSARSMEEETSIGANWHASSLPGQSDGSSQQPTTNSPRGESGEAIIQQVEHLDPAAQIDRLEAEQIVRVQEAGFVERNLGAGMLDRFHELPSGGEQAEEEIVILQMNRNPVELRESFCTGSQLKPCREALEAEGHMWRLLQGTLVFVHPWQYRRAMVAVESLTLHPDLVIVSESLEYLVGEAIANCPHSKRLWCKRRDVLAAEDSWSNAATDDEDARGSWEEDAQKIRASLISTRSFLCVAPQRKPAHEVNQSTTEADHRHGCNPRRAFVQDDP